MHRTISSSLLSAAPAAAGLVSTAGTAAPVKVGGLADEELSAFHMAADVALTADGSILFVVSTPRPGKNYTLKIYARPTPAPAGRHRVTNHHSVTGVS